MSLLGPPSFFSPYGSLHSGCCCRVYFGIRLFSRAKLWSSTKKISVQKMPQESCALELSGLTTLLSASKMVAAPSYNNAPYNFFFVHVHSNSRPLHHRCRRSIALTVSASAASASISQTQPSTATTGITHRCSIRSCLKRRDRPHFMGFKGFKGDSRHIRGFGGLSKRCVLLLELE